jgi:crotonobetainyl-CoA:carnitine CoA-transferase CaiB-like acyl-CoA transferase
MTKILEGVRILEVAEHTFVPAASAALADLGAEVIKIEHITRGDAMRGLGSTGVATIPTDVHALLEHSNRGKQSLALDLAQPDGLDILYRLAATCDVFLTNKLPTVRTKLKIDVDDIRAHNPDIIYVRGSGQGDRGPDADKGSYDALAYWARAGIAVGGTPPESPTVLSPPAPAFGDSIGAMTIAGGIMGALFHRERTGHATVVDVSLLGTGLWSMGAAVALSLVLGIPWTAPPADRIAANPLTRNYRTSDGRTLAFTCLQAGQYWGPLCDIIGRPELKTDPRFADVTALMSNSREAIAILDEVFAAGTLDEWRRRLEPFIGQWAVAQNTLEAAEDPQTLANGYLQECRTAAGVPFRVVTVPVQYDEQPATSSRSPEFNEHGDAILESLGLDMEQIIDLKLRNVVA